MKLTLFAKKPSPEEIEREVTDEIEALVRSSEKPPPPEWTLIGGLPVEEPATAGTPAPVAEVEDVEVVEELEEEDAPPPPPPARSSTRRARSGASRSRKS